MPITITFDLEDNRASATQEERFPAMTERVLDFLAARDVRATVFVVGEIARTHPALIRAVAESGHELGLHGLRHVTLGTVGRGRLRNELETGRALLEDVAQTPVRGFRAPIFSLTPQTAWAVDEIAEAGFAYSSSVLPARNPLHGWPGAPRGPFRWPNGLVELPCPVAGAGRVTIPFLGGIYLRYIPRVATTRLLRRLEPESLPWSYLHPYDVDADEPFFVLPHANWLTSRIVHTRRAATLPRLDRVLRDAGGPALPLGTLLAKLEIDRLPVVA